MALTGLVLIVGVVMVTLLMAAGLLAYLAWGQPEQMGTAKGPIRVLALVLLGIVALMCLGCVVVVVAMSMQLMPGA